MRGVSQAPLLVARDPMGKSIGSAPVPGSRISRCRDNRLDFAADESVHADGRGGLGLTSGGSEAPTGSADGARGSDGATSAQSCKPEAQTVAKTRKSSAIKTPQRKQSRPARKRPAKAATAIRTKTRRPPAQAGAPAPGGPARQTKKGCILVLLQRPAGATIDDLVTATNWQSHSVRAALTGLRNEGRDIVRAHNDAGVTQYRIAAEG
jgi:hypothetical protein